MNRIYAFRNAANLTQKELAEKLGITQGAVAHYETGKRMPSLVTAHNIASVIRSCGIDCSINDLFPICIEDI